MSDPQTLARQVGETMFAVDVASKDTMGMALLACEPGRAVMRMEVKALHLNGHQICHGGFIFTLADSTFAFACNSYNKNTVAAGCSIEFLKPGRCADLRRARADPEWAPRHLRHEGHQPAWRSHRPVPWQKCTDPRHSDP